MASSGSERRGDHHGQPVRLADHEPCRRDRSTRSAFAHETRIVSAHRTPERLYAFAKGGQGAGFKVIIAGAGGAAHLPGMTAAHDHAAGARRADRIEGAVRASIRFYSIVQMPPGVPVGTLAIGKAGAINAALLAASVLALGDPALGGRLEAWRQRQTQRLPSRRRHTRRAEGAE